MLKAFNDFDDIKGYEKTSSLPKGGYGLKIKDAVVKTNSVGQYVHLKMDIAEGDYKGYFTEDYDNQDSEEKKWHCNYLLSVPKDDGSERDGWTKRKFKTVIEVLEASNAGYHFDWDEEKFKGLIIGGLFNNKEYYRKDGSIGTTINLARLIPIEQVRSGNYKLPDDKRIERDEESSSDEGFVTVSDAEMKSLPFD